MPKLRIKGPAPVVFMVPCHRMEVPVGAPIIGTLVYGQQNMDIGVYLFKIVQFVRPLPYTILKESSGREVLVLYDELGFLGPGMPVEISPHQLAVPAPVVLGIGRGMYAHKPATGLDVPLKSGLLAIVQNIARSIE